MYGDNLNVVVVGGSLSGLWTAIVLQSLPAVSQVTIIERSTLGQLQDLGAGIRVNPEAIDALRHYCNIGPENYATNLTKLKTIDEEGKIFFQAEVDAWTTTWGQLYRLFRENFDERSGSTYRLGCKLEQLQSDDGRVTLSLRNEHGEHELLTADLVIGADGASSTVRALLNPDIKRVSVGYCCYRGVVPFQDLSEEARGLWDRSMVFHRYPAVERWTGADFVSYPVPSNEASADQSQTLVNWVWYRHKTDAELADLLVDKKGTKRAFSLGPGLLREKFIAEIQTDALEKLPVCLGEAVSKTHDPFIQLITDSQSRANVFMDGKVLLVGDAVGGQRPHTASAFLQATLHAIMVGKLVDDTVDLETWSEETRYVSSILVNNGIELGEVLMSDELSGQEKAAGYGRLFMGTQVKLNAKWKELIGIGDSEAKI